MGASRLKSINDFENVCLKGSNVLPGKSYMRGAIQRKYDEIILLTLLIKVLAKVAGPSDVFRCGVREKGRGHGQGTDSNKNPFLIVFLLKFLSIGYFLKKLKNTLMNY